MANSSEGRMRLTVLGGYLGSGKTTWLRHQLHAGQFGDAHIVVNEAAETPIDDALLSQAKQLSVLAGGCACCDAKSQLITLLREICDERSNIESGGKRLNQIVLETSGLADPGAIVDAVCTDAVLVHHILVIEIVVAVDSLHALDQLRTEPLGRRQIETADRLILTKVDEVDTEPLMRLRATLAVLNPGASVSAAIKGSNSDLPSAIGDVLPEELPDISGATSRPPIFPARIVLDDTIDWTAFSVWLSALLYARGDDVVRVKGVVRTPAGRLLLQSVRRAVQSPEILPEQTNDANREDNVIVVIGRGYRAEDLTKSLRSFSGDRADRTD